MATFTPRPLYRSRKRDRYPLNMRLGGPDTFGADISHALTGIKPGFLGRPACNLVIVPNTPYLTGVKKH